MSSWYDAFWDPEYWLPPGNTWADFKSPNNARGFNYPQVGDLFLYTIPLTIFILCLRFVFEKTVSFPFGRWLGIPERKRFNFVPNSILEKAFMKSKPKNYKLTGKEFERLAGRTQLEVRQVERWFRKRTVLNTPTKLKKFSEASWRLVIYSTTTIVGTYTLWSKDWFWDFKECFRNYPYQHMSDDLWLHYILASSLYWSLLICQFFDTQRKDFKEMFFHHVITLGLITFSFTTNFVRIGSLILITHDVGDVILESAKMSNYAKKKTLNTVLNISFTIAWLVSRIYVFPVKILGTIRYWGPKMMTYCFVMHLMEVMLIVLFLIQLFWTYFLLKMVYKAVISGGRDLNDERSFSEGTVSESDGGGDKNKKTH